MFESLAEQIKHDNRELYTPGQRILEWSVSVILAAVIIGGLYMAMHLLQPM